MHRAPAPAGAGRLDGSQLGASTASITAETCGHVVGVNAAAMWPDLPGAIADPHRHDLRYTTVCTATAN